MLKLNYHAQFKKDIKLIQARRWNIDLLAEIVYMLRKGDKLPERCRDKALAGRWKGYRDCHIQGDWILVYKVVKETNTLWLMRTGSHADLGFV